MKKGSICLDVRTQMDLFGQLCDEIAENGFNKILVLNCHGGNVAWLDAFARDLGVRPHKFVFGYVRVSDLMTPHTMEDEELVIKYHKEDMLCCHARISETAYIMGISPKSVRLDMLGLESGLPKESSIKYLTDAGIITDSYNWFRTFPNWYEGHAPVGGHGRIGKAAVRLERKGLPELLSCIKRINLLLKV